jgi:hypothetical protein
MESWWGGSDRVDSTRQYGSRDKFVRFCGRLDVRAVYMMMMGSVQGEGEATVAEKGKAVRADEAESSKVLPTPPFGPSDYAYHQLQQTKIDTG